MRACVEIRVRCQSRRTETVQTVSGNDPSIPQALSGMGGRCLAFSHVDPVAHAAACGTNSATSQVNDASRNRESRLYNALTGNLGLHTAHHKRPGLHWSLLPELHERIRHRIPDERIVTSFW